MHDDGAWEFDGRDGNTHGECDLRVTPLYDAMKDLRQNDDVSDSDDDDACDDDDDENFHMAWCTFSMASPPSLL